MNGSESDPQPGTTLPPFLHCKLCVCVSPLFPRVLQWDDVHTHSSHLLHTIPFTGVLRVTISLPCLPKGVSWDHINTLH